MEALAGSGVEERIGEELRSRWEAIFDDLLDEISPLAGA
ncbi:MAG: HAD family hydrolase, partial [Actinobacteria bacterium]|nr:HAD family hydrolase [Actinomycetota bacterium]